MKHSVIFTLCLLSAFTGSSQQVMSLYQTVPNAITAPDVVEKWDTAASGRISVRFVTAPNLTAYLPEKGKANGTAVVICPGGGYSGLVMNAEGSEIAAAFNKNGVTAFVLKYRLPSEKIMVNKTIGPLQDAQQAIRIVRERAKEWGIDPGRIGIIGFSAGGHLASTASTHFNDKVLEDNHTSVRPDFSILVYPVISFADSLAHKGSRRSLLGKDTANAARVDQYSNEKQVTANTPPTFLVHSTDDRVVPVMNSIVYYEGLLRAGVKAEMHIYFAGGHGYGLHNKTTTDDWFERCLNWMRANKLL